MKKHFVFICVLLIITCLFSGCEFKEVNKNVKIPATVIIDAGHGGKDAGAIGIDGSLEKNINLSIAIDLYDFLMISGIESKLIRAGDYEFYKSGEQRVKSDLYNRLDFINSFTNARLISIHQNHFDIENENGCQIWYSPNDEQSKILADSILTQIKNNLQPENNRENKKSDNSYYLLYKATCPSIMVECGFVSNREENKNLQNEKYQKEMAFSILEGISEVL